MEKCNKLFEFSNHLGNVINTVSDRKFSFDSNSDGTTDYYKTDTKSATDYYAYGQQMPGRTYSGNGIGGADYRYDFNGKENDKQSGWQTQDYGFRSYDYRLGRFFSHDPLFREYPELTPYQFASNTPIQSIDRDGLEEENATGGGDLTGNTQNTTGTWETHNPDGSYTGQTAGDMQLPEINIGSDGSASITKTENGAYANLDNSMHYLQMPYVPTPQQQATYNFCDAAQKVTAGGLAAPFVMEAFPAATYWVLTTSGTIILEELAGYPNPYTSMEKQALKEVATTFEEKLMQKGITGFMVHGTERMAERGFTTDAVLKIVTEGSVKQIVHRGVTQIHYSLGKYTVVIGTQGQSAGKIITVMGDMAEKTASGIPGPFTGF